MRSQSDLSARMQEANRARVGLRVVSLARQVPRRTTHGSPASNFAAVHMSPAAIFLCAVIVSGTAAIIQAFRKESRKVWQG
jgi:hypothetical protein